jgi:polyferredoxin
MVNNMLNMLPCAHCQVEGLELRPDGQVVCGLCGTVNHLDGIACAYCEQVNAPGEDVCANCRRDLLRTCPACETRNWNGAEACGNCGAALDSLSRLSTRFGTDPAVRLNEQSHNAAAIKAREAADAERRSAEFEAIEQRRLAELAVARQRKMRRQRWLAAGVFLLVIVFGSVVSVLAVRALFP